MRKREVQELGRGRDDCLIQAIKNVGFVCRNIALEQEFPCREPMHSAQENCIPPPVAMSPIGCGIAIVQAPRGHKR